MPEKGEKQRISRALDSASLHAKILRSRPPLPCPSPAASRDGLRLDFNSEPYHVQSGDISSIAIVGSSGSATHLFYLLCGCPYGGDVGRGYGQGSAAVAFSFRAGTELPRGDADGHEAVAGSKRSQINLFGNMQADTGHRQYSVGRLRCWLSRSGHIASNGSTRRVKSLTCYHQLLNLYSFITS